MRGNKRKGQKIEEIPRKEMPIAATGQPTTQEPRIYPRLPATPEPVPKGADLFDEAGTAESPERTEYGGAEGGRGLGGYSYSGARGFLQPGSASGSPPQSPPTSSFLFHPLHHHQPHQMAMEPPRTRSRSRSGYYQQYGGGNGNGITGNGVMGSNHQQQQQLQQQHNTGCAPFVAHSNHSENQQRAPGTIGSHGFQRLSATPGAHLVSAAGKSTHLVCVCGGGLPMTV